MKKAWRENLKDALTKTLSIYSPDFTDSKEAVKLFYDLVDALDDYEESLVVDEKCDINNSDYWAYDIWNDRQSSFSK